MNLLKIGSIVYAVHKTWVDEKAPGSKIRVGKVISYENPRGEVLPIIKETTTGKGLINVENNYLYNTIEDAIEAITIKKVIVKKSKVDVEMSRSISTRSFKVVKKKK